MARTKWSDAWRQVGAWALRELKSTLGDDWVDRCWNAEGRLPSELLWASAYTVAFGFLVEWALRLHLLHAMPGIAGVRRGLQRDFRDAWRRHASLQLEVAALGLTTGHDVRLEVRRDPGLPPSDVWLGYGTNSFSVEAFAVMLDEDSAKAGGWDRRVQTELLRIESVHGVSVDGEVHDRLDEEDLQSWLRDVERIAIEVVATGTPQSVATRAADLTIRPPSDVLPRQLTYPVTVADGWPRTVARLKQKAEQARSSGATWLRADFLDGIWWASPWAQGRLFDKTSTMGARLREALGDEASLAGVVVSSSPCPALSVYVAESARAADGAIGLRRLLPLNRVRETIIVPLGPEGGAAAELWLALYDREAEWLDWALAQAGLPSVDAIMAPVDAVPATDQ
jgi:hypothetical protein